MQIFFHTFRKIKELNRLCKLTAFGIEHSVAQILSGKYQTMFSKYLSVYVTVSKLNLKKKSKLWLINDSEKHQLKITQRDKSHHTKKEKTRGDISALGSAPLSWRDCRNTGLLHNHLQIH